MGTIPLLSVQEVARQPSFLYLPHSLLEAGAANFVVVSAVLLQLYILDLGRQFTLVKGNVG